MRAIAQILYFLATIPGLAFLNSVAANFNRAENIGHNAKSAKASLDELKKKKKETPQEKSEDAAS